jgi:hypothetical protein
MNIVQVNAHLRALLASLLSLSEVFKTFSDWVGYLSRETSNSETWSSSLAGALVESIHKGVLINW